MIIVVLDVSVSLGGIYTCNLYILQESSFRPHVSGVDTVINLLGILQQILLCYFSASPVGSRQLACIYSM